MRADGADISDKSLIPAVDRNFGGGEDTVARWPVAGGEALAGMVPDWPSPAAQAGWHDTPERR